MLKPFEFATATRIIFGGGTISQAGVLARDFGGRALVVTGRDSNRARPLLESLSEAGVEAIAFPVDGEPDLEIVRRGVAEARSKKVQLVLAMGGGSALDAGKAIAALAPQENDILDYLEVIGRGRTFSHPSLPFIAIPTTSGTGSEVTRNAVLSSPEHRVKASLRSPMMLPKVALIDPELTWGLPRNVTARTGLDALTQLIEPYVCNRAHPLTDGLCVEGLTRAARSLRIVCENGADANAREEMALASLCGGLALSNSGLGVVHGLAGPIGGMFPAPHGEICAALLPHAMASNIAAMREREPGNPGMARYETVAKLLTGQADATAEVGVNWVRKLTDELGLPKLGHYGVKGTDLGQIIEKSRKASSMKANPIVLTDEELRQLIESGL
jgi:alcohol dehydrogenase class IV